MNKAFFHFFIILLFFSGFHLTLYGDYSGRYWIA